MGKQAVLQSSQAAGDKEYLFPHHSSPLQPPKCSFLPEEGEEQSKISHAAVAITVSSPPSTILKENMIELKGII